MQTLFMLSLGAASLGGAAALSALYYYARSAKKDSRKCVRTPKSSPAADALRRRRIEPPVSLKLSENDGYRNTTEYERRRAELEDLNYNAVQAVRAIDRALDAASGVFTCELASPKEFETAKPFHLKSFD